MAFFCFVLSWFLVIQSHFLLAAYERLRRSSTTHNPAAVINQTHSEDDWGVKTAKLLWRALFLTAPKGIIQSCWMYFWPHRLIMCYKKVKRECRYFRKMRIVGTFTSPYSCYMDDPTDGNVTESLFIVWHAAEPGLMNKITWQVFSITMAD